MALAAPPAAPPGFVGRRSPLVRAFLSILLVAALVPRGAVAQQVPAVAASAPSPPAVPAPALASAVTLAPNTLARHVRRRILLGQAMTVLGVVLLGTSAYLFHYYLGTCGRAPPSDDGCSLNEFGGTLLIATPVAAVGAALTAFGIAQWGFGAADLNRLRQSAVAVVPLRDGVALQARFQF
jgi:hypothetical protein